MTDPLDDAWQHYVEAQRPRSFGDRFLAPIVGLAADALGWLDRRLNRHDCDGRECRVAGCERAE